MIVGTGSDLVEIERVATAISRHGERFLHRVYTCDEIAYCNRKVHGAAESFAARFAAKEAGAKALGTGIAQGVAWQEIEVRRLPGQRPTLHFTGRAAQRATALGVQAAHLTLSHSRSLAFAVVVLEAALPGNGNPSAANGHAPGVPADAVSTAATPVAGSTETAGP